MTTQSQPDSDVLAQRKVAQKYKLLGYDVQENPGPDRLPEFLRGAAPDIVARSNSDNVVVEVKRNYSLKGSNEIVEIAERVSNHPDWRFELVVLDDNHIGQSDRFGKNYPSIQKKVEVAIEFGLLDLAYAYLAQILVMNGRDLARKHGIKISGKTDGAVFSDMNFKGIIPETLTRECLTVLDRRNDLTTFDERESPSEADLKHLLQLCGQLSALV